MQEPPAYQLAAEVLINEEDDVRAAAAELKPFNAVAGSWFVGRTGYTGEDGFEVILPERDTPNFWRALASAAMTAAITPMKVPR